MPTCRNPGRAAVDRFRAICRIQIEGRPTLDGDCVRPVNSGLGAGGHLYRSQCLLQSSRAGDGGRDWFGSLASASVVSPRFPECQLSPLAECPRYSLCHGLALWRLLPSQSRRFGNGRFRRSGVLWYQWIPDIAYFATAAATETVDRSRVA
jgi:hypothetical protein